MLCFLLGELKEVYWEYCLMSGYIVNQRWRPLTGSRYGIMYISTCTHDSNEITTATPTFLRSSNSVELVSILPNVNGSRKSKIAAVKPEVHVTQLEDMIESKFQRYLRWMSSRMANSMALRRMLSDVSGSRKSKMAAAKPEMQVSQLVDMAESEFKKHIPCFRGWLTQWH